MASPKKTKQLANIVKHMASLVKPCVCPCKSKGLHARQDQGYGQQALRITREPTPPRCVGRGSHHSPYLPDQRGEGHRDDLRRARLCVPTCVPRRASEKAQSAASWSESGAAEALLASSRIAIGHSTGDTTPVGDSLRHGNWGRTPFGLSRSPTDLPSPGV